jgi:hypothetical protein
MALRRCKACGENFTPWPQSKNQRYCSAQACQRERRRRKQAEKRARSPSVRANDAQYFRDWSAKNPDYWKKYRAQNPDYTERNRIQQRARNLTRIAKDTLNHQNTLSPGLYQLIHVSRGMIANEDAWVVELRVLSRPTDDIKANCKMKR